MKQDVLKNLMDFELVMFATLIEKRGAAYYEALAKRPDMTAASDVLSQLASDENRHALELSSIPMTRALSLLNKEAFYRSSLAEELLQGDVFPDLKSLVPVLDNMKSPHDAITLGIRVETASIALYSKALESTDDRLAKSALMDIIDVEKRHLQTLQALSAKIK